MSMNAASQPYSRRNSWHRGIALGALVGILGAALLARRQASNRGGYLRALLRGAA